MVRLVEEFVCDVDEEDEDGKYPSANFYFLGRIPLQLAVLTNNTDISRFLISKNSCVDHSDFKQCSASHLVTKYDKWEQFLVLLEAGADFCNEDRYGKNGFDIACECGRTEMVLKLIERGCLKEICGRIKVTVLPSVSAFHLAARNGHLKVSRLL